MNRNVLNAGLISTALLAGAMNGCVGYNVYPPELGTSGFTNPNSAPMYQIMTEALTWAVKKYPPGSQLPPTASDVPIPASEAEAAAAISGTGVEPARVAISLFSTMSSEVYRYAVKEIGQGAVPLTPQSEHLPRYMVSRVWVLGDEAKVDVFRPVEGMGTDNGVAMYQPITVNLRGGMKFWRVTSYRVWSIGTFAAPAPEYLPGSVPTPVHEPAPEPIPEPVPAEVKHSPASEAPVDIPSDPA
jgi:hypothetical protein